MSVEAADIYKQEQENGVAVGYKLPEVRSDAYFRLFKVLLDASLDSTELEKAYKRICRKKFSFQDNYENSYTLAVVNVKFNYIYKPQDGSPVNLKSLREHFYTNGFCINGVHYVRYKRSAGSSREGKCLFIDERLLRAMSKWSECGLNPQKDLASWESYKALSLSSIKGTVEIPLDGILFVSDYKSVFQEDVVSVEIEDGKLSAKTKQTQITNDIWDGESLLDESVFQKYYADRHMLLLRGKFFKSCAFRTKLQKWFKDKNITLDDLKRRGFVTLAEDISQIVMVTTPNSLKYLKFVGGLTEKNIRQWATHTNGTFGVVKYDTGTRFFRGKMVQSSYQLLNTLSLSEDEVKQLLQPSIDYISLLRRDIDFMRYHFTDAFAREKDGEEEHMDGLAERADVIFTLMHKCPHFDETELYANFRGDVVRSLKERLKRGHILLNGTNATLFGNGTELLKYLAGEDIASELRPGQIRCERFEDGAKLLCARSPHITMGNLYCAENVLGGGIWDYFDLGENIVCVNAIGENIQQRLNGCDYDSDTMLITDDALLVNAAERYNGFFVQIIDESKAAVNRLYQTIRTADEQEREVLYEQIADIKAERYKQVAKWLTNENVLILVLRHYEKNSAADWRIYAAFINHPIFSELLYEDEKIFYLFISLWGSGRQKIHAYGILLEDKAHHFGAFFVDHEFFILFFVAVQDMTAGIVSFQARFVHAATNLLG